jgi:hypothetical protein
MSDDNMCESDIDIENSTPIKPQRTVSQKEKDSDKYIKLTN